MAELPPGGLAYDDVEKWMSELAIEWPALLRRASLGSTQKYVVKDRWGGNPDQMRDVWTALKDIEDARINKTATGTRLTAPWRAFERWKQIGVILARDLTAFEKAICEAEKSASAVEISSEAAFASPTPKPDGKRK